MDMNEKRLEGIVFGKVQGVMFRDFICRHARARKLTGRTWNNADGTVGFVAEGPEEKLQEFVERIRRGPHLSKVPQTPIIPMLPRVEELRETWGIATGEYTDFQIVFYNQ